MEYDHGFLTGTVGVLIPGLLPRRRLPLSRTRVALAFGASAVACPGAGLLFVNGAGVLVLGVVFGPSRALAAGAVLAAVWSSTVRIPARVDQLLTNLFETV
jgi:hypothetical protein